MTLEYLGVVSLTELHIMNIIPTVNIIFSLLAGNGTQASSGRKVGEFTFKGLRFTIVVEPQDTLTVYFGGMLSSDDFLFQVSPHGKKIAFTKIPQKSYPDGISWPTALDYIEKTIWDQLKP